MKHEPKYKIGQLLLFKLMNDEAHEIDLGMIIAVNRMKGRVFGHYTYKIEWFKDLEIEHNYVEEETISIWVKEFNTFRSEQKI